MGPNNQAMKMQCCRMRPRNLKLYVHHNDVINVLFVNVVLQMCQVGKMHERGLFIHSCGWPLSVGWLLPGSQSLSSAAALPCCVTPTMLFFVPWGAGSDGYKGILTE